MNKKDLFDQEFLKRDDALRKKASSVAEVYTHKPVRARQKQELFLSEAEECPPLDLGSERYALEGEDEEPQPAMMYGDGVPSLNNSSKKKMVADKACMVDRATAVPALPEDVSALRETVVFERISEKIFVNMVAVHKDTSKNAPTAIKAHGDPLGGYSYSPQDDNFLINCFDYKELGIIPLAFRISVPGYDGKYLIPLPESLIFKYASPTQRKSINNFIDQNRDSDIHFVQSLSRN